MPAPGYLIVSLLFLVYLVYLIAWFQMDFRKLTSGIKQFEFEAPRSDLWHRILDLKSLNILRWVTVLFYAAIIFFSIQLESGPIALGIICLAMAVGVFPLGNSMGKVLLKRRAVRVEKEGRRLIREGKEFEVEALLGGLSHRKEKAYSIVAVNLLKTWGSMLSMNYLLGFDGRSGIDAVRTAGAHGTLIQKAVAISSKDKWKGLRLLVNRWTYWKRLQLAAEGKDDPDLLSGMKAQRVPPELQNFFLTQHKLHQHFPSIYCTKDLQKATLKNINGCNFIRCPHCLSGDSLVYPVAKVIGEIGGNSDEKLVDGVLRLSFWDEVNKRVSKAAVDEVRIFDIPNIDWAVAAAVERLENEHPAPKPMIHVEEGLNLTPNTREIIGNYNEQI